MQFNGTTAIYSNLHSFLFLDACPLACLAACLPITIHPPQRWTQCMQIQCNDIYTMHSALARHCNPPNCNG